MKYKLYQIDAFTDSLFHGNPAAVCPLGEAWLPDQVMQAIAMENNLAETAFYIEKGGRYEIRWFTPLAEVELCGHATLAAAHALFAHEGYAGDKIEFGSKSGPLSVSRAGSLLSLDFPSDSISPVPLGATFRDCFGLAPQEAFKGSSDYMLVFDGQKTIRGLKPDLAAISRLDARGVIATARGDEADFVSRCFFPRLGINEDPVTGSAHTTMVPYWSKVLSKRALKAIQLSARGGRLECRDLGPRTEISGQAVTFFIGEMRIQLHPDGEPTSPRGLDPDMRHDG
jgi:PhzF family phenazine biosynthesis protein